jgi:hypothetical protein
VKALKEGDQVDCVKYDSHFRKMCWSHAKVVTVTDSHIKVSFFNERDVYNRFLEKEQNAHELAPFKSRCTDFDWRMTIKAGDLVDACDTSHIWYNATVLNDREVQIDNNRTVKEIFIGYRIYTPQGEKVDHEGQRFVGWSSRYDEWISVNNPRVAAFGKMAKKLYMGSSSNSEDQSVDDTNDKVLVDENRQIFAVPRKDGCKSIFLVELVQSIGEKGGWDRVIERMNNEKNWMPIDVMSAIVNMIGQVYGIFHRDFAYELFPKVREALYKSILTSPTENISNFTKERMDDILKALDPILKRIVSVPEKNDFIENLNLEICSICFGAEFLDRRLQGLKTLLEMIRNVRYGSSKLITGDALKKFINSHNIFSKIYGSKGHVELVKRSSDFLRYMVTEGMLTTEYLDNVWESTTKGDVETKLQIYKIFNDISIQLKPEHLDFVIQKVGEIPS